MTSRECGWCSSDLSSRRSNVRYCTKRCGKNAAARRFRERNPGYYGQYKGARLPQAERAQMEARQGGLCACCGRSRKLVADHCHKSERIRGLLCSQCNVGLGMFEDDPELLWRAIAYLNMHKEATGEWPAEEPIPS